MRATPLHREVFKAGSKTYFNSSIFFPADVRDDVFVLYGFVRVADNFVDSIPQQPEQFHAFVDTYRNAAAGQKTGDTIIDTFVELAREKDFDPAWTDAFLHSMELDLTKSRHETLDEMLEYVYGSAEVIGLYMSRIMGLDREADEAATMLGRAMQVINFIRDIAEDNTLGRVYLPISESSLPDLGEATARTNAAEFKRFVRAQLERYKAWQAQAERGYSFIPRRYLIPIKTAADMYNWTAEQIAEDPFVVFRQKVKPARSRIVARAARNAIIRGKGE
ncbi:MAG: phytoene/squalene synthase family protein [Spirochaetales bacterium]